MDIKEAVSTAMGAVADTYKAAGTNIYDLLLEEFQKSQDDRHWLVTVSFARPEPLAAAGDIGVAGVIKALGGPKYVRSYKVVEIDDSGKVVSMRMRTDV